MHGLEIEAEIHSGPMSKVFRARDPNDGQKVALKVPTDMREPALERFSLESAILAGLSHPAIVRHLAHGGAREDLYLAMEWLEGETVLAQLRRGRYGLARGVAIAKRVAEGLASAHRSGVTHRDVKPANIVLEGGDAERVKLIDFGIARRSSPEGLGKHASFSGGTWAYMSPEQAMGAAELGFRTDVYSLGCVLFESITGQCPFPAERGAAVVARIWKPVPRIREICPEAPKAVDDLVGRMMAQDPMARFRDGQEVAEALGKLGRLSEEPLAVR
jgi:serine/threonine protein kinase